MTCDCCKAAQEAPAYRLYCPTCLWCGARLIQVLGTLPRPREEIANRRRQVLADWMSYGHEESELRRLAKQKGCFAPSGPVESTESAPQKSGKRR